jgi:hypothetical protein
MKLNKDSRLLLETVFGEHARQAHVEWWKFGSDGKVDPSTHGWGRGLEVEIPGPDYSVYYSPGRMKPGLKRSNSAVVAVHAMIFDDVGTKIDKDKVDLMAPPHTYVLSSSKGNFQYCWAWPLGVDPGRYQQLREAMDLMWGASDGKAPSHLFRLPIGVNGKNGSTWPVRIVSWGQQ